jgi:hypothetical protein
MTVAKTAWVSTIDFLLTTTFSSSSLQENLSTPGRSPQQNSHQQGSFVQNDGVHTNIQQFFYRPKLKKTVLPFLPYFKNQLF